MVFYTVFCEMAFSRAPLITYTGACMTQTAPLILSVPNGFPVEEVKALLTRHGLAADDVTFHTGAPGLQETPLPLPVRPGFLLDQIARLQQGKTGAVSDLQFGPSAWLRTATLEWAEGEKIVRLTEKEAEILKTLHAAQGAQVGRQHLLDKVWGYAAGVETHTLETHIYRLRQKIEREPAKPEILLTDDAGYRVRV